jgi:dynein heavy chain
MHSNGNFKVCYIDTNCNSISDCPKEWYEIYFVFACVWAFGAAMFQDQVHEFLNFMYNTRK